MHVRAPRAVDGDTRQLPDDDYDVEAVEELSRAWLQRCEATGCDLGRDDAGERQALLIAFERAASPDALARVRGIAARREREETRHRQAGTVGARRQALDDAADRWGGRIGSPAVVVEQMLLLRHLVSGSAHGDRLARLVDRSMLVASRSATDRLQIAAFTDPLTGCANRRALERDLERELARCARAELDCSVVAIDVDGLKRINDSGGHQAGDQALLRLVETLRRALRGLDGVYRVGGDEFIIVLPDTAPEDASVAMARIERLGAPKFSWGISSVLGTGQFEASLLLAAADDELYDRRRRRRALGSAGDPPVRKVLGRVAPRRLGGGQAGARG